MYWSRIWRRRCSASRLLPLFASRFRPCHFSLRLPSVSYRLMTAYHFLFFSVRCPVIRFIYSRSFLLKLSFGFSGNTNTITTSFTSPEIIRDCLGRSLIVSGVGQKLNQAHLRHNNFLALLDACDASFFDQRIHGVLAKLQQPYHIRHGQHIGFIFKHRIIISNIYKRFLSSRFPYRISQLHFHSYFVLFFLFFREILGKFIIGGVGCGRDKPYRKTDNCTKV